MLIPCLMAQGHRKEARCQAIKNHHHAVSLAVIVMCLMLKCMETSKVQIQAHTLVWSASFLVFLVLVMFTFCGHLFISVHMVAELVRTKVQKMKKNDNQVNDEDDITIRRGEEVQMGLSSSRRSGRQYTGPNFIHPHPPPLKRPF